MEILCVCTGGKNRSHSCSDLLNKYGYPAVFMKLSDVCMNEVWNSDLVICFDDYQFHKLENMCNCCNKHLLNFRIDDKYRYDTPELILILKLRLMEGKFIPFSEETYAKYEHDLRWGTQ